MACENIDFPSNPEIGEIHTAAGQTWIFTALCIQSTQGCIQGVQCPGTWNLQTTSVITATGAQGTTGTQGVQGRQGTTGSQGTQGVQGRQGATGSGSQGTTGSQGTQGVQGITGETGAQGTAGATGSQGTAGATGSQGTQGVQGRQGATGSQGTSGFNSAVTSNATSPFFVLSLPSLNGTAGSVQGANGVFIKPSDGSFSASQGVTSLKKPVFSGVPQIRSETASYQDFYTYNTNGSDTWSPARTDGVQGPLYILAASSTWTGTGGDTNPTPSNCVLGQLILVPEA